MGPVRHAMRAGTPNWGVPRPAMSANRRGAGTADRKSGGTLARLDHRLVAHALQVVAQLADDSTALAGRLAFAVGANDDRLVGLDDGDAGTATLLAVDRFGVGAQEHEFHSADVDAAVQAVGGREARDELGCFSRRNGEARACCPRVAVQTVDGGRFDGAGAEEALVDVCLPRHGERGWWRWLETTIGVVAPADRRGVEGAVEVVAGVLTVELAVAVGDVALDESV